MISDADVPQILKKDGVAQSFFDEANKEVVSIAALIERYGRKSSWSHTLVDTKSNSATMISQMPGEGNRKHYHPDWDEWWIIIEGEWEWEIEGHKKKINKGDLVFIQRGRKHKITAIGSLSAIRIAVSRYDVAHVYDQDDYT